MTVMNIKQASQISGVSPQNIRYYEREGLLCPQRDPNNAYRRYSDSDLRTLKLIRMLRMLDMPLDDIRLVLEGTVFLPQALQSQEKRLQAREKTLQAAIRFCRELKTSAQDVGQLDVDVCLERMKKTPQAGGFFSGWIRDYKRVAAAQHEEQFTFVPDGPVTTPREFTDALFAWSRAAGKDIVITREGMSPRFTMNGTEYEAYRIYRRIGYGGAGVPVAIVRCRLCGNSEEDGAVSPARRRLLRILRCSLPSLMLFAMIMVPCSGWLFSSGQSLQEMFLSVFVVIALVAMCGLSAWFNYYYHFNDQTR